MLILLPPSEKKASVPGPAISLYTGVLYGALGWASLDKSAQERGARSIAIISAKYGVLRPLDEIEPYKEKMNTGKMRASVSAQLSAIPTELIIDCRSSTYKGIWSAPHENCVEIKIFTKVDGVKKTITHMSKKVRGEVTRLLLQAASAPSTPWDLHETVALKFQCELLPAKDGKPWILEVYC